MIVVRVVNGSESLEEACDFGVVLGVGEEAERGVVPAEGAWGSWLWNGIGLMTSGGRDEER